MNGIDYYNSSGIVNFAVITAKFERWANEMKENGTLKAAMDDLRGKVEFHEKERLNSERPYVRSNRLWMTETLSRPLSCTLKSLPVLELRKPL